MIRNAVLHLLNEQPLLADLYRLPEAGDNGLLCTNLRMLNGKRPVFIEDSGSTFFFPYRQMRFVEMPASSHEPESTIEGSAAMVLAAPDAAAPDVPAADAAGPAEGELELDEELLRRVREI